MFSDVVSVQELLAVEPLTDFKIWGGWHGRHNSVRQISSCLPLKGTTPDTLLVLNLRGLSFREMLDSIQRALETPPAGIFLLGTFEAPDQEIAATLARSTVPIIGLRNIDDIEVIKEARRLVENLKLSGCFLKFVVSSNHFFVNLLNNKGTGALLNYLEGILDNPVIITNSLFEPLALPDFQPQAPDEWKSRLKLIRKHYYSSVSSGKSAGNCLPGLDLHRISVKIADEDTVRNYYLTNLKTGSANYGFLIVEERFTQLNELSLAQFQKAALPLVSELIKAKEIMETTKKYKQNFIYDLIFNNFESYSTVVNLGKIWGWNLLKPHHLLIMDFQCPASKDAQDVQEHLQFIVNKVTNSFSPKSIITEMEEKLVIIIPDPGEKDRRERKKYIKAIAQTLKEKIAAEFPEIPVSFGIGKFYPSTSELCRSYQEAKTALELGKFTEKNAGITHFEDLGIMRLLASIRYEQLNDFCQEYLAELIAFDEKNKTNLLETVQTYFAENGDQKKIAGKLFIHANTLRYRLNKIQELLDIDLQNWDDFLNLYVALKINAMQLAVADDRKIPASS